MLVICGFIINITSIYHRNSYDGNESRSKADNTKGNTKADKLGYDICVQPQYRSYVNNVPPSWLVLTFELI